MWDFIHARDVWAMWLHENLAQQVAARRGLAKNEGRFSVEWHEACYNNSCWC